MLRMPLPARIVGVDARLGQIVAADIRPLGPGDRGSAATLAGLPVIAFAFGALYDK